VFCLFAVGAFVAFGAAAASGSTEAATINPVLHVVADNTDVDHSDPALSYSVLGWQIEQSTCDTLVGYSDHSGSVSSAISPLGAAGMPVITNSGKTYTFTIRSGLHFSNGDAITAANFKYAFDRDALKNLNSPVTAFMGGVVGWNIENNNASVHSVSGVTASGRTLTVKLLRPDGTLLPKLALPFFCPLTKNSGLWTGSQWNDNPAGYSGAFPGSGPYYLASRTVGSQIVLQQNTHYSGPKLHKANTIVIDMNVSTNTAYNGIESGLYASDLNGNPEPANNHVLFNQYGKNHTRFWVESTMIISYVVMNQARPTFAHVKLRQAVNMVLDRPGALAISGFLSGSAQTQVLPKALAGSHFTPAWKYPISTPNNARFYAAKALGNNCDHYAQINYWHGASAPALLNAALIKTNLSKIGCRVTDSGGGYGRYVAMGIKGNHMDIATAGWSDDYPDGYDWFGILFNGRMIQPANNNDLAYMNNPTVNKKTDACNKLAGSARTNCWGALDQWMTATIAPWATIANTNFVDYVAPNAHNYKYNGPFASVELNLFYQS
jgi:peptide/nickel transport system substrate-binding protein